MLLAVPTLFLFMSVSLFATGIAWLVAAFAYRSLVSARYWGAAMLTGAVGAGVWAMRGDADPFVSVVLGNALMLLAIGFCWAGIRKFQGRPVPWGVIALVLAATLALLAFFFYVHDDIVARIVVVSLASFGLTGVSGLDLLDRRFGPATPGTRLAAAATLAHAGAQVLRIVFTLLEVGGAVGFATFNGAQAVLLLFAVFGAQIWNAGFLMMAIDRLRGELAELAVRDDLTGVANRRHFLERARIEVARSARTGTPLALVALDIDRFKAVNDTHGHAAGDVCLQRFAAIAAARLRETDMLARLGGDEFVILLPDTDLAAAGQIAEEIAAAVKAAPVAWRGESLSLTSSAGVVVWSADIGSDIAELVSRADRALYLSKQAGRDRVTVVEPPEGVVAAEPVLDPHRGKLRLRS